MRVLVVGEQLRAPVPGGIGTYVRGLVKGLSELSPGVEVSLLASRASLSASETKGRDPLESLGVPVVTTPLPSRYSMAAWDAGLLRAPQGWDVVHATSLAVPPASTPVVVTVHDLAWRALPETFPARGRLWHELALRRALRRGSRFVTPSESTRAALVGAGAPEHAVEVVEEGVDHLAEPDHPAAGRLLGSLGVHGPFVAAMGTLEPRKNLRRLLEAWDRAVAEIGSSWRLVVVGPRGWGGRINPGRGAVLAGEVGPSVLSALYRAASAVAYVPLLEGFGLPAVEAMSMGTPVLASPMPSTAGAALEVDPRDVGSISSGLIRICLDDGLRDSLSVQGLQRASELRWRKAAEQHVMAWEACL